MESHGECVPVGGASMKVPPKRKGNQWLDDYSRAMLERLNESPSEKEGKSNAQLLTEINKGGLNESPSEKEGKWRRG